MSKAKKKAQPDAVKGPPMHSATNYQAQDDMHTLKRAHQIKADAKRHAAAKDMARTEAHSLKKVAGRK